jgi:hypothetical protein
VTPKLWTLAGSGNDVAALVTSVLARSNLTAVQSFDLNSARAQHANCECPHHATDRCNCQMIVLLVYGETGPPVTMTIHGRDGLTELALLKEATLRPVPELQSRVTRILSSEMPDDTPSEVHE